jgi:hypothetical protein
MGFKSQIMRSFQSSLPVRQAGTTLSLTVTLSVVEVFTASKNRFHLNPNGE